VAKIRQHHIRNFSSGDTRDADFFDRCFREFFPALCLFANRFLKNEEDAADLVQEVFAALWEDESLFQKQDHIQPWLYAIVRNRCIDWLRRQQVRKKRIRQYISSGEMTGEEIDEAVKSETTRQLMAALDSLPLATRKTLIDHYIHGRKYTEIAAEQNQAYDSLQKQAARALIVLRKKIHSFFLSLI
jgi:RNA polymerase sigma-70 factor (family 1)